MLQKGGKISRFPVLRKKQGIVGGKVGNPPVAQPDQIGSRLPPGQHVVIVHIDRLVGVLIRFSDQYVREPFCAQVFRHRVMGPGIQNDESFRLSAAGHGTDSLQDFFFIFPCDYRVNVLLLVAELTDAADGLQIEGVLVGFLPGGRKDDADGSGTLGRQVAGLEIGLIAELRHGPAHFLFGLTADGRMILAGAGYGGRRYARQRGPYLHHTHAGLSGTGQQLQDEYAVHSRQELEMAAASGADV